MIISELRKHGLISPPKWLDDNTAFLTRMGSEAYGASLGASSDVDVYGFCFPRREDVFPHTAGFIDNFGTRPQPFHQWTEHHIKTPDGRNEYDFVVYSIVKFFDLAFDASPNIVDALFVPRRCIIHATDIGNMVRENRRLFLNKKLKSRLLSYSFAQLAKLKNSSTPLVQFVRDHQIDPSYFETEVSDNTLLVHLSETERAEFIALKEKFPIKQNEKRRADIFRVGYSSKEAYHVIRLALQAEQVLAEYDLDLERNSQILLSVRRGEWSYDRIVSWFEEKEKSLETLYANSTIPNAPDEEAIKQLLLNCLEAHYGCLSAVIARNTTADTLVQELDAVMARYR